MKIIPSYLRNKIEHRPKLLNIVENIGWLFIDKILRMGLGLLVGVWIARHLGPEQFGQLNYATAFIGLFGTLAGLGLQGIVVRDIVREPEDERLTLGTAALLHLISGILSYLIIIVAINKLRPNDTLIHKIIAIIGASILFKSSEISTYWFEAKIQSKYTVWVQNSVFIFFTSIKVFLIIKNESLTAFAWVMLAEAFFIAIFLLIALEKIGPSLLLFKASTARAKRLLKDSWPLILSAISIMVYMRIGQIMLGEMIGDKEVGIYSAATRISEVWYFIPMGIVASLFPSIIEAKKRSESEYHAKIQKMYDLMVAISITVAIPMTFLAKPIIQILYGETYGDASLVLAIHVWASVFVFLGVAGEKWFLAENQQTVAMQRSLIGAIASILINLALIPIYGAIGAAISLVIAQAIASWLYDGANKSTRIAFKMKTRAMNPFNWLRLTEKI